MLLSKFKKLMKSKYYIDVKQVFINTDKKSDNECVWSEIPWRDCPILVKESGFKSSKPIIKFVARKNFNRNWDNRIYVTSMSFIIPMIASHIPFLINQYATGSITRMPIEQWRGTYSYYGKNCGDLVNDEAFTIALDSSVEAWDSCFKKILSTAFVWNRITSDPEIKERREKIIAIRKQIAALNKQTCSLRKESYTKYVNDEMKEYSENILLQGLKMIDIKVAGNSRYLAAKKAKNQINANNLNKPS